MENEITPAEEVKETEVEQEGETTEVTTEVETTTETKGKTMEEILGDKPTKSSGTVPLATFLDIKKEKKAAEDRVRELEGQIAKGGDTKEARAELKSIAEEYDVDPVFLEKLSSAIYAQAEQKAEERINSKLGPLEAKERESKIDKAFNEHYENVMAELPEYSNVVNKDIIKTLSLLPENSKKTFPQIIEETYGKTVTGKKTLENGTPRGGKNAALEMNRINEPGYFKEIMADPKLKEEYNKGLSQRINL